jgi:Pyruvate/2-oxoacid:ferredoxin oxidoreductase gamma subunit
LPTRVGGEGIETAAGIAARTADAAGAGSTGITACGPHIAHTGSESIVNMTIVQIA